MVVRLRQSDAAQRSEDTEGVSDAASLEGSGVPLKQVLTNIITFKATGHTYIYICHTYTPATSEKPDWYDFTKNTFFPEWNGNSCASTFWHENFYMGLLHNSLFLPQLTFLVTALAFGGFHRHCGGSAHVYSSFFDDAKTQD